MLTRQGDSEEAFRAGVILCPEVVTHATLGIVPAYEIQQRVYADIHLTVFLSELVRFSIIPYPLPCYCVIISCFSYLARPPSNNPPPPSSSLPLAPRRPPFSRSAFLFFSPSNDEGVYCHLLDGVAYSWVICIHVVG